MKTHLQRSFKHGFLLNEQELRRIHAILSEQMRQATGDTGFTFDFTVEFQNDAVSNYSSLDAVLTESNGGEWTIHALTMDVRGNQGRWDVRIRIKFVNIAGRSWATPIEYAIDGPHRDWVYLTSSKLDDRMRALARYIPGYRSNAFMYSALLPIPVTLAYTVFLMAVHSFPFSRAITGGVLLAVVVGFAMSVLVLGWDFFSQRYFPLYNFYWGDYVHVFNTREARGKRYSSVVFGAIILAIVVGLVTNALYDWLR
jgi:hypothetical protein